MNKYLICLDLDGTILTEKKKVRFQTRNYLRKLEKQGHVILISTGRSPRSTHRFYKAMGLSTSPISCCNGSVLRYPNNNDPRNDSITIQKEVIFDIYNNFRDKIDSMFCQTDECIWVYNRYYFDWEINENEGKCIIYVGDISKILNANPNTFTIRTKDDFDEVCTEITNFLEKKYPYLEIESWLSNNYCDIRRKDTTKLSRILKVAKSLNIDEDHIFTFGDGANDISMINRFKHGYAMINSVDEIKKEANNITKKDNDHNGVVYELKKFFKKIKD